MISFNYFFLLPKMALLVNWWWTIEFNNKQTTITRTGKENREFKLYICCWRVQNTKTSINGSTGASSRSDDKIYTIFLFLTAKIHFHNNNKNNTVLFFLGGLHSVSGCCHWHHNNNKTPTHTHTQSYRFICACVCMCEWLSLALALPPPPFLIIECIEC